MAVRAADFALGYLSSDHPPAVALAHHRGDVFALVARVVELKNDGVVLSAVNARMLPQVLPDMLPRGGSHYSGARADLRDTGRPIVSPVVLALV